VLNFIIGKVLYGYKTYKLIDILESNFIMLCAILPTLSLSFEASEINWSFLSNYPFRFAAFVPCGPIPFKRSCATTVLAASLSTSPRNAEYVNVQLFREYGCDCLLNWTWLVFVQFSITAMCHRMRIWHSCVLGVPLF